MLVLVLLLLLVLLPLLLDVPYGVMQQLQQPFVGCTSRFAQRGAAALPVVLVVRATEGNCRLLLPRLLLVFLDYS